MSINYDYAADLLFETAATLQGYDSVELRSHASRLITIGAELRKLAPKGLSLEQITLKPEPPKNNPNSMIPSPVPPPQGSGPAKVDLRTMQAQFASMKGGPK